MAEDSVSSAEFPAPHFPTVFADGIINLATTIEFAKFYLARNDPSFNGTGANRLQGIAQVVMPLSGFLQAFAFLELTINNMAKNNPTIPERLKAAREALNQ